MLNLTCNDIYRRRFVQYFEMVIRTVLIDCGSDNTGRFLLLESAQSITGGCGHSQRGHQHPGESLWWPAQPAQWCGETRAHTHKYTHILKSFSTFIVSLHNTEGSFFLLHIQSHLHKHTFFCPPLYSHTQIFTLVPTCTHTLTHTHTRKKTHTDKHIHMQKLVKV